jgi:hypothetical protein
MSAHSTLDPESLQRLLASAFSVQESGMDTQSLSALVELQQSIATGECDLDGAVHLISERARDVANATGIAIGLLKGDQLVYRAGSGSAVAYIGRHVMATLNVSAHNEVSGEILRVENTQTDARIEAAICRQFGAKALLILPIYYDRAVAGVLEVLFSEAHAFQDREVRTYRLMAGLVGEAMSAALEQNRALAAKPLTVRHGIEQVTPQIHKFLNDSGSAVSAATNRASQACEAVVEEAAELPAQPTEASTMITQRAKRAPLYRCRWKTAVAVAVVLVIANWIVWRHRRPASSFGPSALQRSNAIEQQVPFVPAKLVSADSTSTPQTVHRQVRVGNYQVEYIGEDVTVRYFTPKPAPQPVRVTNNQVHYIGEDVTVRYFTPQHAVAPPQPVGSAAQPVDR